MKVTLVRSTVSGRCGSLALAVSQHYSTSQTHAPASLPSSAMHRWPAVSWTVILSIVPPFLPSSAASPYAQQEEQSLCRRLLGLTAGRKRLVDSTIGEEGHGDGHHGAKTTMPTGGHHVNMWASPETRIRGRGAFTCRGG